MATASRQGDFRVQRTKLGVYFRQAVHSVDVCFLPSDAA